MRITYDQLKQAHLRNINLSGSTDTDTLADFNLNLGQRYQLILAKLNNFKTQKSFTFQSGINVTLLSSNVTQTISSITSSSTTATVTTSAAHGYSSSNVVNIFGADPSGYNGTYTITVTSTTTFTYTLPLAISVSATNSASSPYAPGLVSIEGGFITIGSVNYPLRPLLSRWNDEQLNSIQIQASAIPQFYFVEADSFKIWPIPQTTYTGTIYYHYRDRNLSVADYASGTVSLTQGSNRVTGSGTTFTAAMVGRWFTITDTTIQGQGYWYRITGYTDATHITLGSFTGPVEWNNASCSGAAYNIGETPEIPEELHSILPWGTAADFYAGMRKDPDNAVKYDNLFWTGNPTNVNRTEGDSNITGGLLGAINLYKDRDNRHLIKRKPRTNSLQYKVFATRLS